MGNAGSVLDANVHTHAQRDLLEKRATAIYVSPSGNDSAAGTLAAPLKSIQRAIDKYVVHSIDRLARRLIHLFGCAEPSQEIPFTSAEAPMP
jgi:hypothetical protein